MKNKKNEETMACKVIKKMDERTLYLTSQQVVCIARGEGGAFTLISNTQLWEKISC